MKRYHISVSYLIDLTIEIDNVNDRLRIDGHINYAVVGAIAIIVLFVIWAVTR